METKPLDVFFDGVNVFVVFFFGVGVVKTQVTQAVVNIRQTEVQADGFGVSDVQVAVGFWRETGLDGIVFAAFEVFFDEGADEVVVRELIFIKHGFLQMDGFRRHKYYRDAV